MLPAELNLKETDDVALLNLDAYPDRIASIYDNKTLFVTGSTGFVGKGLIERVLHNSNVKRIYALIKDKRGCDAHARFASYFDSLFFESLKKDRGVEVVSKLHLIVGDVREENCGISEEDCKKLHEEVDIFYHGAVDVRFDGKLKDAIRSNVCGTRNAWALAREMKQIKLFVHVSTLYCGALNQEVTEDFLHMPYDPHMMMQAAENIDSNQFAIIAPKIIQGYGTTYTFTKCLTENLLSEYAGEIPLVIVRPSVIMSSLKYPIPGYTDSLLGPMALWLAIAKGLARFFLWGHIHKVLHYTTLDIVVSTLMVTTHNAIKNYPKHTPIYNCTSFDMTNGEMSKINDKSNHRMYPKNPLGYPTYTAIPNTFVLYTLMFVFQLLPAAILDAFLKIAGRKQIFVDIQRKIYRWIQTTKVYFEDNIEYNYKNDAMRKLHVDLNPREEHTYPLSMHNVDLYQYFMETSKIVRIHLLNEKLEDFPAIRKNIQRFYYAHVIMKTVFYAYCVKVLYHIGFVAANWISDYCTRL